jgi:hypothetical protein
MAIKIIKIKTIHRVERTEEKFCEMKDRSTEIIQSEQQKKKKRRLKKKS